ncbi:MAG TPA: glycosyltransferase family 9 protein, partial [Candidatus Binatia bacterium]|nr:glycosyltransferase family 9 protein [Candidatus Binatia bacterium]
MRNRDLGSEVPADVLFIRLRLLGDIIFTIPALQIYKQHRPHGRVYYVVEERFRELAGIIPGIDEVISVPSRPGWRDIWNFRKRIKELNVRTAVDFHSGPTSALLTLASGASLRVGYRTPNRNWAYTRLLSRRHEPFPTHSVLNQARLLEKIGIPVGVVPPFPALDLSPYPVSGRVDALRDIHPKVIMHLGSGNRFRDWGLDNFSALVDRLSSARIPVVFIGRSAEEARRAGALSHFPHTHDLSG